MKKTCQILVVVSMLMGPALRAQLVDKTPAALPAVPAEYAREPYEDPLVSSINRDASRATAYSFSNLKDAIGADRKQIRKMALPQR